VVYLIIYYLANLSIMGMAVLAFKD